jgi:hypothetical protein
MITPLANMEVYKEILPDDSEVTINQFTPDPIETIFTSEDINVKSVGDGEVVAAFDDTYIIKTFITNVTVIPSDYVIPTNVVLDENGDIKSCDFVHPNDITNTKVYYITYANITSDLMINDTVKKGDLIGQTIDNKLKYTITSESGIDIEPYTII